jgi:hypothetical protein
MFSWLFKIDVSAYLCQPMTGLSRKEIFDRNERASKLFGSYGIKLNSPVSKENIIPSKKILKQISDEALRYYWKEDKDLIRKSHILIDLAGWTESEGVKFEIGFARYALFLPIIRIHPTLGISVGRIEVDDVYETEKEAAEAIIRKYGTRFRRICWRIEQGIVLKWLKLLKRQFIGLFK